MDIINILSIEFKLTAEHVSNIITLLDQGSTIPFIARYRKEMTGSCDDQVLRELSERLNYLRNLEERKEKIIQSIVEQEKMTEELSEKIKNAETLSILEDIYRPFRPKRRTRAVIAKEKGLESLADAILKQDNNINLSEEILIFTTREEDPLTETDALSGAKDIIAEIISDDAELRGILRELIKQEGLIRSVEVKADNDKEDRQVYEMYYDYSESVNKIPSHRILAINRAEREKILKVSVEIEEDKVQSLIFSAYLKGNSPSTEYVKQAAEDAWVRLIQPSIEREIRNDLTEDANIKAISMFALNLKPLLLQPPVRGKTVIGYDPAFRTGCKIAVVDATGKILDTTVIYPTAPHNKTEESKKELLRLIKKHNVEVIAIGNGTASKESELFVSQMISEYENPLSYIIVNESGASVYSASKQGAEELPEYDVSLRSAVSIARRLQDPLAELVKIDPKSIGVGQYQHDMPAAKLDEQLSGVVEYCVNSVGVDLNTASFSLLTYISGIGKAVAKNIVAWRDEFGAFNSREELKKVPKLGLRAFEQSAGFLRITKGENILDNTSVHPESYNAVKILLKQFDLTLSDINSDKMKLIPKYIIEAGEGKVAETCGIGVPTLRDIVQELQKPGRDIRDELPAPVLRTDVMSLEDLKTGMELIGTVRNVIDFGAFVDIGVHQDGLIHISELSDRFIKHPLDVISVGDIVKVSVLSVDINKKRIALSMKNINQSNI